MKKTKTVKTVMITKSALKSERDWTDTLIDKYLPEPDETRTNPTYKCAAPMKLYRLSRVKRVEKGMRFQKDFIKAQARKASAEKASDTKYQQLMDAINLIEIVVPIMDRNTLIDKACKNYNDRQEERLYERGLISRDNQKATPESDPDFLERITVNYLRHCCTEYKSHLCDIFGKVGKDEAYNELKRRVLAKIAETYPELTEQCQRQCGGDLSVENTSEATAQAATPQKEYNTIPKAHREKMIAFVKTLTLAPTQGDLAQWETANPDIHWTMQGMKGSFTKWQNAVIAEKERIRDIESRCAVDLGAPCVKQEPSAA